MNIIFGDSVKQIPNSYTVLELDTLRLLPDNNLVTAYYEKEKIPLNDYPLIEVYVKLHHNILINYRQQHWDYCEKAIDSLMGKWNGDVDTFYQELLHRITQYKQTPPPSDWDGTHVKTTSK